MNEREQAAYLVRTGACWPCSCDVCTRTEQAREQGNYPPRLGRAQEVLTRNLVARSYPDGE